MAMPATRDETTGPVDPTRPVAPQVADALREAVIGGDLPPGARISEAEIAARYGVSRQPVREAFIRLSVEGLIAVLPHRGTTVARIAVASVIEARFVREAVEADIVRLLAEDPERADLPALRAEIAAQRSADPAEARAFIALDDRFHQRLAEAAGKAGMWRRVHGLKAQMDRVRVLSLEQFPMSQLVAQHVAVVDRIAAGDPAEAERAMRAHLRAVLSDLPAIIAAHPDFFDAPEVGPETKLVSIKGGKT